MFLIPGYGALGNGFRLKGDPTGAEGVDVFHTPIRSSRILSSATSLGRVGIAVTFQKPNHRRRRNELLRGKEHVSSG